MNHKDNHGQVGEALKLKMKLDMFHQYTGSNILIADKTEMSLEELYSHGLYSSIPLIIDQNTKGDYEVICEHGVEVRYFND